LVSTGQESLTMDKISLVLNSLIFRFDQATNQRLYVNKQIKNNAMDLITYKVRRNTPCWGSKSNICVHFEILQENQLCQSF
jgi:hypothetical protein